MSAAKIIALTLAVAAHSTAAFAHSPLDGTAPSDTAVIATVPETLALDFKGNIRLTRVSMVHAGKHAVDLDISAFKSFAQEFSIPMQDMGAGLYQIEWRGLGDDGHPMTGTFSFTVE